MPDKTIVDRVTVETKSPLLSKINWTNLIGPVIAVLTIFWPDLPPDTELKVVTAILAVQSVLTIVFKTFFTSTITPASAQSPGVSPASPAVR